jgi:hypothetical protein
LGIRFDLIFVEGGLVQHLFPDIIAVYGILMMGAAFRQSRIRAFSVQLDALNNSSLFFDGMIHGFGNSTCADRVLYKSS